MRLFIIFCFGFRLFASSFNDLEPSTPDETLSLNSGLLIEKYVSAISGQLVISETDLCVKGAQDLCLNRIYITPQILGRYKEEKKEDLLITSNALLQLQTREWVIYPHLEAGYNRHSPYFQVRDPSGFVLEFEIRGNRGVLKNRAYGCSNLQGDRPNSAKDIRNIELEIENDKVKISWPDGTQRYYSRYGASYTIEKEMLPNGKAIFYEYDKGLLRIRSSDPTGKYTYATITQLEPDQYIGSDGRKVIFDFKMVKIKGKRKKENFWGSGDLTVNLPFRVMSKSENPNYTNTMGYHEKTLLNSYDAKDYPISCTYFEKKNEPFRIETFSTPSGNTIFSYDPVIAEKKGGSTTVIHPNGAQTIYRFSSISLLEAIENRYENRLINRKSFAYDAKQHIKSIETFDGSENLLVAQRFECDEAGNPILETTEGDFGKFSIRRKYDQNRLIFEESDNGLQIEYTYHGKTWLPRSKTIYEKPGSQYQESIKDFPKPGSKLRKTIYHYDEANNLRVEEEEGRTRLTYILYESAPHLHRVEWEEMRSWDGSLLYKIRYDYDQWGNTQEEKHYGSDDKLAYTIQRIYNEKGELCEEINPLEEKALYEWDERGRCYYEKPISNGLTITRTFDAKGRLKVLTENDRKTLFEYDSADNCIEKIDYLGYITAYDYDRVHGKPNCILHGINQSIAELKSQGKNFPKSFSEKVDLLKPESTRQILYDAWGREAKIWDAYGFLTQKEYNSYGKIAKIIHPNEGTEIFAYHPDGSLERYIDPDGLTTTYSYDVLGRLIKKTAGSYPTSYIYDGYDLKKIKDSEGFITEYEYDVVGRKVKEKKDQRITQYGYDPLGFLAWEKRGDRRVEFANDSVGRLRKKSVDGVLETVLTYDRGGNINSIQKGGITLFQYDAHNQIIREISPEEYVTTIRYENQHKLLLKKITDPQGIETIETYNHLGALLKKEVAGQTVMVSEYDQGVRLKKQDHLTFDYTPKGQKKSMKESGLRETKWTYTLGDKLHTQVKPDGELLIYNYDSQGRLEKVGNRRFSYNSLNQIIGGTHFSRTLDRFGNIKREEWTNGLWIESDYDDWDRPIKRRLPDLSSIQYKYKGPFLVKVTRISKEGQELYSYTYQDFDARGNPQIESGFFETQYKYDQSGRKISCRSPFFYEESSYNPGGKVTAKGDRTYSYDSMGQMTSESNCFTAQYDIHYNLRELNGQPIITDMLNQIEGLPYDLNGNMKQLGFTYDEFNQLIQADGEPYIYDSLGRRVLKGNTAFLYIDQEEIGAFENGRPKELKVPGSDNPIAIEIDQIPYAPILDTQGTIRFLVDSTTGKIKQNNSDAFGSGISSAIPYAYAGKRYDGNTGLIYFGKRYYDPAFRRWLTLDPIGPSNHSNLYQYLFNNPYLYQDKNGEFAFAIPLLFWGAELAIPTISVCITSILGGVVTGAAAYGGYKLVETFNHQSYFSEYEYNYTGILNPILNKWIYSVMKNGSVDPSLPANPDDFLKRPGWEEKTHPNAGKKGHRTFENIETGEQYRHDEGRPGETGHEATDHWHHLRPNGKGGFEYLDGKGNPVPKGHDKAHIYRDK